MTQVSKVTSWTRVLVGSQWTWRRRYDNAKNVLAATTIFIALIGAGAKLLDKLGTDTTETMLVWMLLVGLAGAVLALLLPVRTIVREKVKTNEEVTIEVAVGNILDKKTTNNAMVVPTNVEGEYVLEEDDVQEGKIRMSSVQGQYTRWMELEGCGDELRQTMEKWRREFVHDRSAKEVDRNRGKIILVGRKQEHRAYWFVLGRLLSAKGTQITESDYLEGLLKGWYEMAKISAGEDLVSPVIGGGQMKLPMSKTDLVRDLVHTFIDAQSRIRVCKRLTIVIRPEDLKGVSVNEMSETVTLECRRFRRTQSEQQSSEVVKGTVFGTHE